ncbi:hypothetical protein [Halopelagius fulvigenes]|uniref:Hydrogenase maturation nickel metallochaperone HypA n=1 Tax=Halopelagius fulvigenes TaxID=1198324 RepID=A0ABD5U0A5_9EURY
MDGTATIGRLLRLAGLGPRDGVGTTTTEYPYVCLGCGVSYDVEYHVCPNCGGFSVEHELDSDPDLAID